MFGKLVLTVNGNQFYCHLDKNRLSSFQIPEILEQISVTAEKIKPTVYLYARKDKFFISMHHEDWSTFFECEVSASTVPAPIQAALRCSTRRQVTEYIKKYLNVAAVSTELIISNRVSKLEPRSKRFSCYTFSDGTSILLGHNNVRETRYNLGKHDDLRTYMADDDLKNCLAFSIFILTLPISLPLFCFFLAGTVLKEEFTGNKQECGSFCFTYEKTPLPEESWDKVHPESREDMLRFVETRSRFFDASYMSGEQNRGRSSLDPTRYYNLFYNLMDSFRGMSHRSEDFLSGYNQTKTEGSNLPAGRQDLKYIQDAEPELPSDRVGLFR